MEIFLNLPLLFCFLSFSIVNWIPNDSRHLYILVNRTNMDLKIKEFPNFGITMGEFEKNT